MNEDRDLQREIQAHLESEAGENIERGMTAEEARAAAMRAFGNPASVRERVHEARPGHSIEVFLQDVRYGLRLLRRSPVLAISVVLTLALGVGVNTGMFAVLEGMLFRARVDHDPASFIHLAPQISDNGQTNNTSWPLSTADYRFYRDTARSLTGLAAWTTAHAQFENSSDNPLLMLVSCNFFSVYGLDRPKLGRLLLPDDCASPGSAPVAVLSEEMWRNRFASDPGTVGSVIKLERRPFTVIGIVPERFAGRLRGPGIWIPYTMAGPLFPGRELFGGSNMPWLTADGRLQAGATRASALAELVVIAKQLDAQHSGRKTTMSVTDGSMIQDPYLRGKILWVVPVVMSSLTLLLLLACANVTMLLLSRAVARRQEIAVRLSLGAGRGRLVRMLVTESLILSAAAGGISVWLAYEIPAAFQRMVEPAYHLRPDWTVFAYLAGVTLIAGCMAGLTPAAESLRVNLSMSLKGEEGLFASGGRGGGMRGFLVGAQVAMSLVLLTGAGLFLHAQTTMFSEDPGFEMQQVLTVPLDAAKSPGFYQRVASEAQSLPGVQSVSFGEPPPMFGEEGAGAGDEVRVPGQPKGSGLNASTLAVGAAYFETLRIPLVFGRAFREKETGAAVVSEALARGLWPGRDALGELVQNANGDLLRVVGIARDTRSERFGAVDGPRLYIPRNPQSMGGALMVRFAGDAAAAEIAIRNLIRRLDREMMPSPRTLDALRREMASRFWRMARIVLGMGAAAMLLAVIGIYGVMAFAVSRRTREIGIRMALGATKGAIVRTILRSGMRPLVAGLGAGSVMTALGAAGLAQILKGTPMALNTADPLVYAAVAALLIAAAVAAMFLPALRAAAADPVRALRHS